MSFDPVMALQLLEHFKQKIDLIEAQNQQIIRDLAAIKRRFSL